MDNRLPHFCYIVVVVVVNQVVCMFCLARGGARFDGDISFFFKYTFLRNGRTNNPGGRGVNHAGVIPPALLSVECSLHGSETFDIISAFEFEST